GAGRAVFFGGSGLARSEGHAKITPSATTAAAAKETHSFAGDPCSPGGAAFGCFPFSHRPRSSANAPAVAKRWRGSLAIAFRQMFSIASPAALSCHFFATWDG